MRDRTSRGDVPLGRLKRYYEAPVLRGLPEPFMLVHRHSASVPGDAASRSSVRPWITPSKMLVEF